MPKGNPGVPKTEEHRRNMSKAQREAALLKFGSVQSQFLEKWKRIPKTTGCWVWPGARHQGYGSLRENRIKKTHYAHRLSWELHHGSIPEGLQVCHKCDNPPCVRPDHLFLGTHIENFQDCLKKGRHIHGERTCTAKLTEKDILTIRNDPRSCWKVGSEYGISGQQVSRIRRKDQWRHIP